jgi:hypothetical protein
MGALLGNSGTMSAVDEAILDHYRSLCKQAGDHKANIQDLKSRIREQMQKVSHLDAAARDAKNRYQKSLLGQGGGGTEESVATPVKQEVANTEADLTEAKTILQALESELPKLDGGRPDATTIEAAKRAAWEAIARHLQSQVPAGIDQLVVRIFAATLGFRPDAPFSVALSAVCPVELRREKCEPVADQLAKEYNIPH